MKNEIKAFKKLIESKAAFEHFKNSVNIFVDPKIETREELSKYAENNHKSEALERIILDYLTVQREKIEKVYQNIDKKGRNYTAGGNVLFVKIPKLEELKNEIITILKRPNNLQILEPVLKAYNHPSSK